MPKKGANLFQLAKHSMPGGAGSKGSKPKRKKSKTAPHGDTSIPLIAVQTSTAPSVDPSPGGITSPSPSGVISSLSPSPLGCPTPSHVTLASSSTTPPQHYSPVPHMSYYHQDCYQQVQCWLLPTPSAPIFSSTYCSNMSIQTGFAKWKYQCVQWM